MVNAVVEAVGTPNEASMDQIEDRAVVKNNEMLSDEIAKRDEGALKYPKDIKWYGIKNEGFKLEFYFDTNPYFKNTVLTKTCHTIDEDEPIPRESYWDGDRMVFEKEKKKLNTKGPRKRKPQKDQRMPSQRAPVYRI